MLQINISWHAKYVDCATHEIHKVKCKMNNNYFTVVYNEIGARETGSNTMLPRRLMHYVFSKLVLLMNSFNKTDAAIFAWRLCFFKTCPFSKIN